MAAWKFPSSAFTVYHAGQVMSSGKSRWPPDALRLGLPDLRKVCGTWRCGSSGMKTPGQRVMGPGRQCPSYRERTVYGTDRRSTENQTVTIVTSAQEAMGAGVSWGPHPVCLWG